VTENLAVWRLIFPSTNSFNCQPKWEHKNTTFLTINELPKPATIPNLATERTSDDSDWIHSSINRAARLHRSSKNGNVLPSNNGTKLLWVSGRVFSIRITAFLHVTPNALMLLSSSDHSSQPYRLLQYVWNSLVLTAWVNLPKKHNVLLT